MRRRNFLGMLGGAAAWPFAASAQQPMPRIGHLRAAPPPDRELEAFLRGLAENGLIQGRNYALLTQWGDGNIARLSELAIALVNSNVDIIVTEGTLAVRAVHSVTGIRS